MGAFRDLLSKGGRRPRWIDATDYCGRLLAAGDIPWGDVTRLVDWHRKAQGLLRPDVAALPLVPLTRAWIGGHESLREAMSARRRLLYPLKTLLSDEALRDHIRAILNGLRLSHVGVPLALVLPAPADFVGFAAELAGTEVEPVDADDADSAAMYMADFLRAFGDSGIDALLLETAGSDVTGTVTACAAVLNIAGHYRWDVGLRHEGVVAPAGIDFQVAAAPAAGLPTGLALGADFWRDGAPTPEGGEFIFASVPADAQPETVLQRLQALN